MQRLILLVAALAMVQACQDTTSPPAGPTEAAPGSGELAAATALTANSVGIQVRKLLFFGGGFNNQSFHAVSVC